MNRLHRLPRELVELVRKLRCSGKGGLYTFFLNGCFNSQVLSVLRFPIKTFQNLLTRTRSSP